MIEKSLITAALACAPLLAASQVSCTMPNGVVITQKLSSTCPSGATKGVTADGRLIALPAPPIKPSRTETANTPPQPIAPPSPVPVDKSYEYARAICTLLEGAGATTCEVNSNIFSTSTIEATLATSPMDAAQSCRAIAAKTRAQTSSFKSKNWKLLIFSPFSGNRPIAACEL